jgi:CheY-like chemotaxis protein
MRKNKKVLIIEDNEDDLEIEKYLLKDFTLFSATSLRGAIDILNNNVVDIIITDLDIKDFHIAPNSNNLESYPLIVIYNLLLFLQGRIKDIIIIVVSGYNNDIHRDICLELGCQDYINKETLMNNKLILKESINKSIARLEFIKGCSSPFFKGLPSFIKDFKCHIKSIIRKNE